MTSETSPISTTPLVNKYAKYPRKKLIFLTVKSNKVGDHPWNKIGKINDWIRRYAESYVIVKGTCGGTHFHGLLALKSRDTIETLKPQKGIHFHFQDLTHKREVFYSSEDAYRDHIMMNYVEHIVNTKYERITGTTLTVEQQEIGKCLCSEIKKYFIKQKNKIKNKISRNLKKQEILKILNYLQKNLDEPREDSLREYTDWIIK